MVASDDIRTQRDYLEYARQVHSYSPAIARLLELSERYIPDAEAAYYVERRTPSMPEAAGKHL